MASLGRQAKSAERRPIAVDLFSGVGGMGLGFEQAGFDVVCAVESDPAHAAVHRFNFPLCEVLERDATSVTGPELAAGVEQGLKRHGRGNIPACVDVVFGGPPCQGFSVGGLMDPRDPRNELIEHFARLVLALSPRAFVLENVPAMATRTLPSDDRPVPRWITARMRRAGYAVAPPRVLNASHFGVPQDRRRLVMIGVETPFSAPDAPMATHAPRAKAPLGIASSASGSELDQGPSVWDAIGDLPNLDGFDELIEGDSVALSRSVRSKMEEVASDYARRLAGSAIDATDLSRPRRRSPSQLTSSLRTLHREDVVERFAQVAPGEREPVSRFVRLHPDGVAPTLRAGSTPDRGSFSAPRPIHPNHDRVISVREAARLHGYPDWFRFSAAKWHGFRQVGNSVCPPFAKAIAESVRNALNLDAVEPPRKRMALGDPKLLTVPSGAGRRTRERSPGKGRDAIGAPEREAA
jgi:DNA (cytosine-5)-methyltransferase 1